MVKSVATRSAAFRAGLLAASAVILLTACGGGGSDVAPAGNFTPPEEGVEQASDGIGAMTHSTEFADLSEFHPISLFRRLLVLRSGSIILSFCLLHNQNTCKNHPWRRILTTATL